MAAIEDADVVDLLSEYGEDHEKLATALDKWGRRRRGRTRCSAPVAAG